MLNFLWFLLIFAAKNYYEILGISKSADKKQIKRAYRELSKKYHPDKAGKEFEGKFIEIAQAYEVLVDDEKRRIYDKYGEEGLKGSGQKFHDPFDVFSQFGGGFFRHERQERKAPPVKLFLDVSLEHLYSGKTFEMEINKQIICPKCRGSGAKSSDHVTQCPICGGSGIRIVRQQLAPGFVQQMQTTCDKCHGHGTIVKEHCPLCSGKKVKRGSSQFTVTVEKGMKDGQMIIFEEEADQYPDQAAGDVQFIIKQVPHAVFSRKGNNLYMTHTISLKESLLGFNSKIQHLDGKDFEITRADITPPGFVQVVKGKGMPRPDYSMEYGDLFVEYQILYPASLNESQLELLKNAFN